MNKLYDNGYYLLGTARDITLYIEKINKENEVDEEDDLMLQEIKTYAEDSILCINYEGSMGWTIEEFPVDSEVKLKEIYQAVKMPM